MSKPIQVVAIAGGKGGVGKTNVAINLGVELSRLDLRVTLFDAALGLGNSDVLMGLKARESLVEVIEGELSLAEVVLQGPCGLSVVPAGTGRPELATLSPLVHAGLIRSFSELAADMDVLVVDTAAGIAPEVLNFLIAAREVLLVVTPEPTSINDAFGLLRVLSEQFGVQRASVVTNMVRSDNEARDAFLKLEGVCGRFLDLSLRHVADIPLDESVRRAVRRQSPVVELYPRAPASLALRELASQVAAWPVSRELSGQLEFFVDRVRAPAQSIS
ncbi:MAG: MinD/ParA family protein [Pseudomonadota bacterium]